MREDFLVARAKKRFRATTDSKHGDPIAPNLVERNTVRGTGGGSIRRVPRSRTKRKRSCVGRAAAGACYDRQAVAFSKLLVANRGEIAVRIFRTARRLGLSTVAVYSSADVGAPHVHAADEAVWLGPAPASESYLVVERVIDAAKRTGAEAVHPGYGFLSENAAFARACTAAGLVFVGPPSDAIELMGNKRAAKRAMHAAGVRCVPGFEGDDPTDEALCAASASVGFPLMVKAAAGGGGRGMRLVMSAAELPEALAAARGEALRAFKSGELLLERAILEPRHVEVQIFADAQGEIVHLGERDCSVQRRHQKVLEESPSPAVDAALRAALGAAAVRAAKACGYVGAGTVEFLLDRERSYYFLEMNTRIQVEHPVTELVTGTDLVEWQLRVAQGEPLPLRQSEIAIRGHAIEARLYAEDPALGYLPQTGTVLRWEPTSAVRVDHALADGLVVSPHYDPMLAKVIAHGKTRDDARRALVRALRETTLFGVASNKTMLVNACEHETFARGLATTAFLAQEFAGDPSLSPTAPESRCFALAALVVCLETAVGLVPEPSFLGWRSGGPVPATIVLAHRAEKRTVNVLACGGGSEGRRFAIRGAGGPGSETLELQLAAHDRASLTVVLDGVRRRVRFAVERASSEAAPIARVWLDDGMAVLAFDEVTHQPARREGRGTGRLLAPLDGAVIDVRVAVGDTVSSGQLMCVLEAMKMQHRIVADTSGTVTALHIACGMQVRWRQLLAEIVAESTAEGGA
ncbi:MAG: ATP-grasp domain-containing protein [Myxococcales bacterium]|nr:ATP-grasp domain-containing protein [Myxococcales bacterium]